MKRWKCYLSLKNIWESFIMSVMLLQRYENK